MIGSIDSLFNNLAVSAITPCPSVGQWRLTIWPLIQKCNSAQEIWGNTKQITLFFLFSVSKYINIKPLPELIKNKAPSSILNTDTDFLYCCSSYISCRSYLALHVCLSICIYSLFLFVRFFCICFYLPLALFSTVLWKCFIENKDKLFIGVI